MDYKIQDTTLTAIADAINAKTGETAQMTPLQMPGKIESIPSGGGYNLTIITNYNTNLQEMSYKINDGTYTNFQTNMNFTIPNCKKVYLNGFDGQTIFYLNDGVNRVEMATPNSSYYYNYCIGLGQDITLEVHGIGPV